MLSAPLNLPETSSPLPTPEVNPALVKLEESETTLTQPLEQKSTSVQPDKSEQIISTDGKEPEPKRLLTDADIAALRSVTPVQQQQVEKQWTKEEIDKELHIWKPDAKWYERLAAGGEEAMKAVEEQRDGLNKQFARRLQLEMSLLEERLSGKFAPGIEAAQGLAAKQEEDRYYTENKDLIAHKDVVEMTFQALKQKGILNGKSQSEVQKTVAEETRAWLKSKGIAVNGSTPANAGKSSTTRKVPAQLSANIGGSGSGGKSADSPTVAALRRVG